MTMCQVSNTTGLSVFYSKPVAKRAIFDGGGIWRSFVIKDDLPNIGLPHFALEGPVASEVHILLARTTRPHTHHTCTYSQLAEGWKLDQAHLPIYTTLLCSSYSPSLPPSPLLSLPQLTPTAAASYSYWAASYWPLPLIALRIGVASAHGIRRSHGLD